MKDDPDKNFVLSLLLDKGFHIEPIPESNYKTPDLKVIMPEGDLLVEVKSKKDDNQLRDLLESPTGTDLSYNVSSAETALRDAWHQIREFPYRDKEAFTLIWFITRKVGGITILVRSNIKPVLYGIEILSGQKADQKVFELIDCYFFNESFFFKYKDLDGVVLHDDQLAELCLNPFSPRSNTFKYTKLTNLFRKYFSITDPREMEATGKCFLADCDIPRNKTNDIVRYLKSKYGLDTVTITKFKYVNYPID